MDIDKLKFPIGPYNPQKIKFEEIDIWKDDIKSLPSILYDLSGNLDDNTLQYVYRPGGWNIKQLIHHLADSHMNALIRFKLALTEDHPTIKPYLEGKWADMIDVSEVHIDASLKILEGVHARLSSIISNMGVSDFNRQFKHPQYEKDFDLAYVVGLYSWHGRHHTEHIKLALSSKEKYKV